MLVIKLLLLSLKQRLTNRLNTQPRLCQLTVFPLYEALQRGLFGTVRLGINCTFILPQAEVKFPYPYFDSILTENNLQRKPALSKISPYKSIGLTYLLHGADSFLKN